MKFNLYATKPLTGWRRVGNIRWRLEFKFVDLWVGAFWTQWEAWVCLLPCLPIHLERIRGQCEHPSCKASGNPCFYSDEHEEPDAYFCQEHLAEHCFCKRCAQFCGAEEGFHFVHPGLCDSCAWYSPEDDLIWAGFDEDEEDEW
jgi:hypothetical protein